jgi:hypothetical protein
MRFVLVNGTRPRLRPFCVLCHQPIKASYLRELGTRLPYCDHDCYAVHCKTATLALAKIGQGDQYRIADSTR